MGKRYFIAVGTQPGVDLLKVERMFQRLPRWNHPIGLDPLVGVPTGRGNLWQSHANVHERPSILKSWKSQVNNPNVKPK